MAHNPDFIVQNSPISLVKGQHSRKTHYVLSQSGFKLDRCLRNIRLLSDYFIKIFRYLNRNMLEMGDFLNMEADVRCNLLAYHLVMWEIAAMVVPELITIDISDLLCLHGALFCAYYSPCGLIKGILDKL